ncbi:metallophosphoesterase family protein [Brevibacterium litoralis]|uniref:metallophosphoesterase family protein n=1 Tax=Brevibacterium litoralis TaxID=3138935 RepID=UPI0032EBDB35
MTTLLSSEGHPGQGASAAGEGGGRPPAVGDRSSRAPWVHVGRFLLVWVTCLLLAAPWALFSARTTAPFGPHMAEYSLSTDSVLTVDLGPLGRLRMPVDEQMPGPLGADIRVAEIPEGSAAGGETLDALGADVNSYATFFSAPEAAVRPVVRGLAGDMILRTLGAGTALAVGVGVFVLVRPRPFEEGFGAVGVRLRSTHPSARRGFGIASAVALVIVVELALVPNPRSEPVVATPSLDGTPLAGAQVTGRMSGLVDEVAALVTDWVTENDDFYAHAERNLDAAWWWRGDSTRMSSEEPRQEPVAAAPTPVPESTAESVPATEPVVAESDPDRVITSVMSSDIHCNTGMAAFAGEVARKAGADLFIDGGDVTMTGTPAENLCVDVLDSAIPRGVDKVTVKGNHDSRDTIEHFDALGWTVLRGRAVEVGGLTFLGDSDPRRTVFPDGSEPEPNAAGVIETQQEFGERIADTACRTPADVLLIHDPAHAEAALETGCVPVDLGGHRHARSGPEPVGGGVRYTSSTTGGALANALTPGPLRMTAEVTIIRWDAVTREPIDLQVVSVDQDTSVTIGEWEDFPDVSIPSPAQTEGE